MAAPSPLLDLPTEILERIITFALSPSTPDELAKTWNSNKPRRSPHRLLIQRLRPLAACKVLYDMALPTYFRHTTLSIIAGSRTKMHQRIGTKSITVHKSLVGTSEQQPLFFDNATKLHLETDDFYKATVDQLRDLLTACKKVVEITVCMQTLEDKRGDWFYTAITRIVEGMRRNVGHQIRVRKETKAEHRSYHAAREAAEGELRPIQLAERRGESAQGDEDANSNHSNVIQCLCFYRPLSDYEAEQPTRCASIEDDAHNSSNQATTLESESSECDSVHGNQGHHLDEFIRARQQHRRVVEQHPTPTVQAITGVTGVSDSSRMDGI